MQYKHFTMLYFCHIFSDFVFEEQIDSSDWFYRFFCGKIHILIDANVIQRERKIITLIVCMITNSSD